MTLETFARKIEPIGFDEQPEHKKPVLDERLMRMKKIFESAIQMADKDGDWSSVHQALQNIAPYSYDETILVAYALGDIPHLGAILSCSWEQLPAEQPIIFEGPQDLVSIYRRKGVLVNKTRCGNNFAHASIPAAPGPVIINYGIVKDTAGCSMQHGAFINYGTCGHSAFTWTAGMVFNLGKVEQTPYHQNDHAIKEGAYFDFTEDSVILSNRYHNLIRKRFKSDGLIDDNANFMRLFQDYFPEFLTELRVGLELGRIDLNKAIAVGKKYNEEYLMKVLGK